MEQTESDLVAALLDEGNAIQAKAAELEAQAQRLRALAAVVFEQKADGILDTEGVRLGNMVKAPIELEDFIDLAFGIHYDESAEEIEATRELVENLTNNAGERLLVAEKVGDTTSLKMGFVAAYEPKFYLARFWNRDLSVTGLVGTIGVFGSTSIALFDYDQPVSNQRMAVCTATSVFRSDDTLPISASSGIGHRGRKQAGKPPTRDVLLGTAEIDEYLQSLGGIVVISAKARGNKNYLGVGKLFGGVLQAEYDAIANKLPDNRVYGGDVFAPVVAA